MGMIYLVEPYDPAECDWLDAEGVALPKGKPKSRNPTPAEIRTVCDALEGFDVAYNISKPKKFWQAIVEGKRGADKNRWANLLIEKWGGSETRPYKVIFDKGEPSLIVQIAHALSIECGPLLVVPDSDTPVVVWDKVDLKKVIKRWT